MKAWFLLPLVFLGGLLLGGLPPRAELRRLRGELDTRKKVERVVPSQTQRLDQFLGMLPMDPIRARQAEPPSATPETTQPAAPPDADPAGTADPATPTAPEPTTEERQAAFEARLEQAAEAWRLRQDLARTALASRTGFTPNEMAEFDILMTAMNLRFEHLFTETAERIRNGEPFTPETGIRLVNELTEAMVLTYDEMDRNLPATWRRDAGESFDLVTFVEPNVVKPMLDVRDQLPPPGAGGRPRFGGPRGMFRPSPPPAP